MVTPINDGKFSFKGVFNLEGKDYQYACVIIDERGNITKEELTSKFKQLIWVTGMEKNIRVIILENLNLHVLERDQTIFSRILSGGLLTKQRDKLGTAIKERNKKVLEFVKMYPDSPISFDEVEELANFINPSNKEKIEGRSGSIKELYNSLSTRLKTSKRGLVLKQLINEKSNL